MTTKQTTIENEARMIAAVAGVDPSAVEIAWRVDAESEGEPRPWIVRIDGRSRRARKYDVRQTEGYGTTMTEAGTMAIDGHRRSRERGEIE